MPEEAPVFCWGERQVSWLGLIDEVLFFNSSSLSEWILSSSITMTELLLSLEGDGESLHFGLADFPKKDVMESCLRFNDMLIEKIFTSIEKQKQKQNSNQTQKRKRRNRYKGTNRELVIVVYQALKKTKRLWVKSLCFFTFACAHSFQSPCPN